MTSPTRDDTPRPRRGRWLDSAPLVALPAALIVAAFVWPPEGTASSPPYPRWAFMWGLSVVIYLGCKWLTWRRSRHEGVAWTRAAAYWLAWPGMDADAFLSGPEVSLAARPRRSEWLFAAAKLVVGLALLLAVPRQLPVEWPMLVGWVGMLGLIFTLHFGLFHLLSCFWRRRGWNAVPLMDWPILSTSLGEFWGRRWNRAFRDLTHRFLFRPLTARFGPRGALAAGFLVSGLVHDLVISIPAGGGYGGPTAFFLIQAVALFVERANVFRKLGLGGDLRGRLWTIAATLLPVALLFPRPFVVDVIVPFLRFLGAVP